MNWDKPRNLSRQPVIVVGPTLPTSSVGYGISVMPNGHLRDIACRDLLRRLETRGLLRLPAPLRSARRDGYTTNTTFPTDFKAIPVSQSLRDFSVIEIEMVRGSQRERLYNALIDRYHYLGYHQGAGEQLKYIILGDGHVLAVIGFGGAAFQSGDQARSVRQSGS